LSLYFSHQTGGGGVWDQWDSWSAKSAALRGRECPAASPPLKTVPRARSRCKEQQYLHRPWEVHEHEKDLSHVIKSCRLLRTNYKGYPWIMFYMLYIIYYIYFAYLSLFNSWKNFPFFVFQLHVCKSVIPRVCEWIVNKDIRALGY